jgi:hypothetical protein
MVGTLSYSRNNTGSIPDRTQGFFFTWNFYWFNAVCTNEDHLLFSRSEDCVMLNYQRDGLLTTAKFGQQNGAYVCGQN